MHAARVTRDPTDFHPCHDQTQSENTSSAAARTSAQSVRAEQSERKRAAILKASKRCWRKAMQNFSLRKVAAAAGVRLSTVQHHFGDLESLILATIDSSTEEFMRYSRQLAQGQYESPTDDLKVFLDDAWTFVRNVNVRNLYLECGRWAATVPSSRTRSSGSTPNTSRR